jgi:hypothetical protein
MRVLGRVPAQTLANDQTITIDQTLISTKNRTAG